MEDLYQRWFKLFFGLFYINAVVELVLTQSPKAVPLYMCKTIVAFSLLKRLWRMKVGAIDSDRYVWVSEATREQIASLE